MPMQTQRTTRSPSPPRRARAARLLVLAVLAIAASPAVAVKPFSADYRASYMGMQGDARMTLVAQGAQRWKYTLSINSNIAQLTQSTVFEERGGQWRPLSSTDASMLLIKKSTKDATYDWGKREATWSGDVKRERAGPVKLRDGDMDAMLINLALVRDVAAGKPLQYRMVDEGRAKDLTYTVAGKESISVAGKQQEATRVVRTDGDRQTIAWVVDGLPVPARILQKKDGKDDIDLTLQSFK